MPQLMREDVNFISNRIPAEVWKILNENRGTVFLAGGFIRAVIAKEEIADIDLIVTDAVFAVKIAEAISKAYGGAKIIYTENAHTILCKPFTVQVIHRWTFTDPVVCIESFDFTIAKAAVWIDPEQEKKQDAKMSSACAETYYQDLAAKRLVYCAPKRAEDAGGSMLRVLKFYQRGYRIPLDSLGRVISRMMGGVSEQGVEAMMNDQSLDREAALGKVLAGLLREVDPNTSVNRLSD